MPDVNNLLIKSDADHEVESKNRLLLSFDGTPHKTIFPLSWWTRSQAKIFPKFPVLYPSFIFNVYYPELPVNHKNHQI